MSQNNKNFFSRINEPAQVIVACLAIISSLYFTLSWVIVGSAAPEKVLQWINVKTTTIKADSQKFTIILADLENDPKSEHTLHLWESLAKEEGFEVIRSGSIVKLDTIGVSHEAAIRENQLYALKLLEDNDADLFVWGRIYQKKYQIGFVPRVNINNNSLKLSSYQIDSDFKLPIHFSSKVADLLLLTVYQNICSAKKGINSYLLSKQKLFSSRLYNFLMSPHSLSHQDSAFAWSNLALSYLFIGRQSGDVVSLKKSVKSADNAIKKYFIMNNNNEIARNYDTAGCAMHNIGEFVDNDKYFLNATKYFEKANSCLVNSTDYHLIAQVNTNFSLTLLQSHNDIPSHQKALEKLRLNLELAKNNNFEPAFVVQIKVCLAMALSDIFEMTSQEEYINESLSLYEEILKDTNQLELHVLHNRSKRQFAKSLLALGVQNENCELIEKSIVILKESLQNTDMAQHPQEWGQTNRDIGDAVLNLGILNRNVNVLDDAADYFERYIMIRNKESFPIDWAFGMYKLGVIQIEIASINNDDKLKQEAIVILKNALEVQPDDNFRSGFVETNDLISKILLDLAGRSAKVELLDECIERCTNSIRLIDKKKDSAHWARISIRKGSALIVKGILTSKRGLFLDADHEFTQVLDVLKKEEICEDLALAHLKKFIVSLMLSGIDKNPDVVESALPYLEKACSLYLQYYKSKDIDILKIVEEQTESDLFSMHSQFVAPVKAFKLYKIFANKNMEGNNVRIQ